jgi:hypothetical protein
MEILEMIVVQIHFRGISFHVSVLPFEGMNSHVAFMLIPETL